MAQNIAYGNVLFCPFIQGCKFFIKVIDTRNIKYRLQETSLRLLDIHHYTSDTPDMSKSEHSDF